MAADVDATRGCEEQEVAADADATKGNEELTKRLSQKALRKVLTVNCSLI
jgi:hypothetical protein